MKMTLRGKKIDAIHDTFWLVSLRSLWYKQSENDLWRLFLLKNMHVNSNFDTWNNNLCDS
jgi:hypothetical protein